MADPQQNSAWHSQYEAEGYLHIKGLLSPRLIACLTALLYGELAAQSAHFRAVTGLCLEDAGAVQRTVASQTDPAAWFAKLDRGLQHLIKGEFPLEVRLRPELLALAEERSLTDLIALLLADTALRFHYPPMLRFKPPNADQVLVPLHQDAPYFPHLTHFVNAWIPLCPITEECGGVNVLVGSHTLGPLPHHESTLWGHSVGREEIGRRFPDRHISMEPGDVLLFGPHLLHYTHGNTSGRTRCSIDCRWFAGATDPTRQYYDLSTRQVIKIY